MFHPARKSYDDLTEATKAAQVTPGVWRMRFNDRLWMMGSQIPKDTNRDHLIKREKPLDKKSDYEPKRADSFLFRSLMLAPWYVRMLKNALGEDAVRGLILKLHSSNRRDRIEAEKRLGMTPEPRKNKKDDNDSVDNDNVSAPQFGFTSLFASVAVMESSVAGVFAPAALLAKNGWRAFSVAFVAAMNKKVIDRMGLRRNLRADNAVVGASTHVAIAAPHPAPNVLAS